LARRSNDGQLLGELLEGQTNSESLVKLWTANGWEVRPSEMAQPGEVSYLCVQGGQTVYAWSDNLADKIDRVVLIQAGN
jgi:hypothetical protein